MSKLFKKNKPLKLKWYIYWYLIVGSFLLSVYPAVAQEPRSLTVSHLDTVWVMVTGALVFFMNAGFAMLRTGLCSKNNAINVLAQNLIVFAIATAAFWLFGYGIMYGTGNQYSGSNGFLLLSWPDLTDLTSPGVQSEELKKIIPTVGDLPLQAHFFFQLTFASTAATIISGVVAERIRFGVFCFFCFLFVFLIYPFVGHWVWSGEGFLSQWGFRDFAGSTVVHSVGGWAGLVGTWLLGPRRRKYQKVPKGKKLDRINQSRTGKEILATPGHNLSLATLGCLILWLGWFGFNGGSTLAAEPDAIAHIVTTTFIAGAFGAIAATIYSWWRYDKPSISFIINGILGGCVSITASCAFVTITSAVLIGIIGGILVVEATIFLDWLEIDDPVGAVPVHLICGFWGTLAVGIFSDSEVYETWSDLFSTPELGASVPQFITQLMGWLIIGLIVAVLSLSFWLIIGFVAHRIYYPQRNFNLRDIRDGLRVSAEEEQRGLDSLFAEGAELEPSLSDEKLLQELRKRGSEEWYTVKAVACRFAVEYNDLNHYPIIRQGLEVLEKGDTAQSGLLLQLESLVDSLEDLQWNFQEQEEEEEINLSQYFAAFGKARAAKSLYLAVKNHDFVTATKAINEAYNATKTQQELRSLKKNIFAALGL